MAEKSIYVAFKRWMKEKYPEIVYRIDLGDRKAAGYQMPGVKYPDLVVFPFTNVGPACFLEIKDGYGKVFTKGGLLQSNRAEDTLRQAETLWKIRLLGYNGTFTWDLADLKEKVSLAIDGELLSASRLLEVAEAARKTSRLTTLLAKEQFLVIDVVDTLARRNSA